MTFGKMTRRGLFGIFGAALVAPKVVPKTPFNPPMYGPTGLVQHMHLKHATKRTLKATYTLECANDLKAMHGMEAEKELANIMSKEILKELEKHGHQVDSSLLV